MKSFLEALPPPLPSPVDLDQAAGHPLSPLCLQWHDTLARRFSRNPHGLTKYAEEARRALKLAERIGVPAAARELNLYKSQLYSWRSKQQTQLSSSEREQEMSAA